MPGVALHDDLVRGPLDRSNTVVDGHERTLLREVVERVGIDLADDHRSVIVDE